MSFRLRAVIDVGTNSVKLLLAKTDGQSVEPILETSKQTRLGRGFYESHRLQPEAIHDTALAVARFAAQARAAGAESIRVVATSAARDAINQDELVGAIAASAQLPTQIISGDQEAEWVLKGVRTDPALQTAPILIVDAGGGSSEFVLADRRSQYFRNSFRLGSVRLLEQFTPADPPTEADWERCHSWLRSFLAKEVEPILHPALDQAGAGVQLIGVGGASAILSRIHLRLNDFDRAAIENADLTLPVVQNIRSDLWRLPLTQRRHIPGLPPKRADVILMGSAIYETIMEQFGFGRLRVSTRSLRFAALLEGAGNRASR